MWAIIETMKSITKINTNHFAITNEVPEINPNPNIPATRAIIKNIIAQANHVVTPLVFILFGIFDLHKNIIFH